MEINPGTCVVSALCSPGRKYLGCLQLAAKGPGGPLRTGEHDEIYPTRVSRKCYCTSKQNIFIDKDYENVHLHMTASVISIVELK